MADGDTFKPTPTGIAKLGAFDPLPTGDALREHWLRELPGGNARVLEFICSHYPNAVSRDAISSATGHARSTRDRLIQELQARQLVRASSRGIVASEELFST